MRQCIFCQATADSNEDVWPCWLMKDKPPVLINLSGMPPGWPVESICTACRPVVS